MKDCVSLDIAKKLEEAGWKRDDRHWIWIVAFGKGSLQMAREWRDTLFDKRCFENLCETANFKEHFAAPTIGELLEALPDWSTIKKMERGEPLKQYLTYNNIELPGWNSTQDNPADALALLWMKLKKKGII